MLVQSDNVVGMVPVRALFDITSFVKSVNNPMLGFIGPTKLLPDKDIDVIVRIDVDAMGATVGAGVVGDSGDGEEGGSAIAEIGATVGVDGDTGNRVGGVNVPVVNGAAVGAGTIDDGEVVGCMVAVIGAAVGVDVIGNGEEGCTVVVIGDDGDEALL